MKRIMFLFDYYHDIEYNESIDDLVHLDYLNLFNERILFG